VLIEIGARARQAARMLATLSTEAKNRGLNLLADALIAHQEVILAANQADVHAAQQAGLSAALVDRLTLTPARLEGIAADVRGVASLPDPVGEVFESKTLANGLRYLLGADRVDLPPWVDGQRRAEEFSPGELVELANALAPGAGGRQ